MTAQYSFPAMVSTSDPLESASDPVEAAHAYIEATALRETAGGLSAQVGLELEFHLVELARPKHRPTWAEVQALVTGLPKLPCGSAVTLEPGGQIELSTPPGVGVVAAVAALRTDREVLRRELSARGFGAAPLGSDIARPAARVNPAARYVAMETHFAALGCAAPGRAMMTATAALQVNVDAGPARGWPARLGRIRDLGPVLGAVSACSPLLAGRASGWASMRQESWLGIDRRRSGAVDGTDPAAAWANYALDAPVMLLRGADDPDEVRPVTSRVAMREWLSGVHPFDRSPSLADLDYHLTTLFPPVRPRGYVEIRYLDAVPDRWWPALAALTVTLIDDPVAAARADELCAPLRGQWHRAARAGLRDPQLHAAANGCLDVAARRCPPALRSAVEDYAGMVARGVTPGDALRERAAASDPTTVLQEEALA